MHLWTLGTPSALALGATDEEVVGTASRCELVPKGQSCSDHGRDDRRATRSGLALAGPDGRGARSWYSWDRLDNGGRPSATEIHPEWQDLALGDHVKYWRRIGLMDAWEVSSPRTKSVLGIARVVGSTARSASLPKQPRPSAYMEGLWAFLLEERAGGRTRMVISGYQAMRPLWLERFFNYWLYLPVTWPMQAWMPVVLKRNIEQAARGTARALERSAPSFHRPATARSASKLNWGPFVSAAFVLT